MIRLRLFARDDPARQIDSRVLDEGEISIGRGVKADWQIADPERDLSRLHLVIAVRGGMIAVTDMSANGVFVGNPRVRLERDRAVIVSRGESIVFGAYLIVPEEEAGAAPDPILPGDDAPFGDGRDADAPRERPRDPFGSALKPDPIKLDEEPDGVDAWERRREYKAGDWDPVAPHRRPDHAQLIGTPQGWAEPPAAPSREHGLGFDAPFTSPILREPAPAAADDVQIPSDWDLGRSAGAAPTDRTASSPFDDGPIAPPPPTAEDAPSGGAHRDALPFDDGPPLPPLTLPADDPDPILPAASADPVLPAIPPEPIAADRPAPAPAIAAAPPSPPSPARGVEERRAAPPAADDGDALFERFCAGARLSPNAFAGEDRGALMERLGAIYRQSILGVADLMGERTALKNDFRMARTTIRPDNNNPFKWVPPQRIAVELLRSEDGSGYSTGERALNEALHDVKAHLLCVLAGMRAALGATFDLLSPAEIDKRIAGRGFVMPGQRSAAAWNEYADLFAALRAEADDSAEGPINRAFRNAYEAQLGELDGRAGGR